jgi:endonuclease/exonuclease/phosphatase family metal-dependent hydrolase
MALLVSSACLVLAGCTGTGDGGSATPRASEAPVALSVMSFNIEYGGTGVDFGSVSRAIQDAGADVVAIQEAYARLPELAADVGWDYYDTRTQVLSRFPLISPDGGSETPVFVEVSPGRAVAVFDVHLSSTKYGPNAVVAGMSADEVLDRESARVEEAAPVVASAAALSGQDIPVLVLGDFNSPSHLDWTEESVGQRPQIRYPLEWPVSRSAEAAGLVDAYRAVHPDPVSDPGITWPAERPFVKGYNPAAAGKPADRIDLVFSGGPVEVTDAQVVGEPGGDGVDISVDPWPSDHRAVVVRADVVPGVVGTVVAAAQRVVRQGDPVEVRYLAGAGEAASVGLAPAGAPPTSPVSVPDVSGGMVTLATDQESPGGYDVVLLDGGGSEIARSAVWLAGADGTVLRTDRPTYRKGQPVAVSWTAAPGNKWDWIGIYRKGADPNIAYYKQWAYTGASVAGEHVFSRPLPPGDYDAHLLVDDSYASVGSVTFTVR